MNQDKGEKKFLFNLYKYLEKAERLVDDNNNEFIIIPSDEAKKIAETLLIIVNRMDGSFE